MVDVSCFDFGFRVGVKESLVGEHEALWVKR